MTGIPGRQLTSRTAYITLADCIALDLHRQIAYRAYRSDIAERAGGSSADQGRARLREVARLSTRQCEVLYWAGEGLPLLRIADRLGVSPAEVGALVADLRRAGIVEVRPRAPMQAGATARADASGAVTGVQTLGELWRLARVAYADRPFVLSSEDGSACSYADAGALIDDIGDRLRQLGVDKGDRICTLADPHPEAALVFWAAMRPGAVFVPRDSGWPPARRSRRRSRSASRSWCSPMGRARRWCDGPAAAASCSTRWWRPAERVAPAPASPCSTGS